MITSDDTTIPLAYNNGLCCLKIRHPTPQELDTLPLIDVSSEEPWQPQFGESDPYDGLQETVFSNNIVTLNPSTTNPQEPDWEHIKKCLGWKPMEILKNTYEHTTQYATNYVRIPMREHFKSRFPSFAKIIACSSFLIPEKLKGS